MAGLKTDFTPIYDTVLKLVPTGRMIQGKPEMVSAVLAAFMFYVENYGAPYDQSKTLDPKFILSSKKAVVSQTAVTFFNQSFPQSEHFLIAAIRVLSGANATVAQTAWTPGVSDALTQNGSFSVINNNTAEMVDIPLESFPLSTNVNDEDAGFLGIEKGILWKGQTTLYIPAAWATAPSTANQNLNIQLWGLKLI